MCKKLWKLLRKEQIKKVVCKGLQQPPSVCAVSLGDSLTAVADFTYKNWGCRNEITAAAYTKKACKSYKTGCFLKWNLLKKQPVLYTIISEGYFTTAPKYLLFFKWRQADTMFVNTPKGFKACCKTPVCAVSLGDSLTAVADFTHKNWGCRNEITAAAYTKKACKSYKTGCFLKWNLLKKQPVLYTIISEGYFTTAPKYLLFFKWRQADTMFVNAPKGFIPYCTPPQSNSKSAKPCHQKQQ